MSFEYFRVIPRVFEVGRSAELRLRALYEQRSFAEYMKSGRLYLEVISDGGILSSGRVAKWGEYESAGELKYNAEDDSVSVDVCFSGEGEYTYRLMYEPTGGGRPQMILKFAVYALEADLFALRPYRGDLHVHTSYSECGRRDEDPKFVAAWSCHAGLDFIVITDHQQMEPSLIARDFINQFGIDYQVFPGEEVHQLAEKQPTLVCKNRFLPPNHFVNFGGSQGVAKYMNDHFEEFQDELRQRAEALPASVSEDLRILQAGADWMIDKIHEFGGLAIFAHPFWHSESRTNLPKPLREYILKQGKYDAMEVVGIGDGKQSREDVQVCVNWWMTESIARGKMIPLVGNTDSHACREQMNRRATIVFAKDGSFESLASGIKSGRSVAGTFNPGEGPVLYGDYRLVEFSYFLTREFYPEHDAVMALVGSALMDYLRGGCDADAVKAVGANRLGRLFAEYWAK